MGLLALPLTAPCRRLTLAKNFSQRVSNSFTVGSWGGMRFAKTASRFISIIKLNLLRTSLESNLLS